AAEGRVAHAGLDAAAHDRHRPAAHTTAEEPRDEVDVGAGSRRPPAALHRAAEASLHELPEVLLNDRELRAVADHAFRFGPPDLPSGLLARDPDPLHRVPGPLADVALVEEHGPHRRVAPAAADLVALAVVVRRGDALAVQQVGDLLEGDAVGEQGED